MCERSLGRHFVCSAFWCICSILYIFHIHFFNVGSIGRHVRDPNRIHEDHADKRSMWISLATLAHSLNEPCKLGAMVHNMLLYLIAMQKMMCDWYHMCLISIYPCHEKDELVRMKNALQYKWYFYQSCHFSVVLMLAYLLSHSLRSVGWPQAEQQMVLDKSPIQPQTGINLLSKHGRVVEVSECTFWSAPWRPVVVRKAIKNQSQSHCSCGTSTVKPVVLL